MTKPANVSSVSHSAAPVFASTATQRRHAHGALCGRQLNPDRYPNPSCNPKPNRMKPSCGQRSYEFAGFCRWQGAAARLKQELAELLETLLRLHVAYSGASAGGTDSAVDRFRNAAVSQLPLLLSAYGAMP